MSRLCLIITDAFPPAQSSGLYRLTALVRHLPASDWNPYVLCPGAPDSDCDYAAWGLPADFGEHVTRVPWRQVQVSPALKMQAQSSRRGGWRRGLLRPLLSATRATASFVRFPDTNGLMTWVGPARRRALELCRSLEPALIYASAPSYSVCTVAEQVHRATGIPWVCEMRDPFWRNTLVHPLPTPLHRLLARRTEARWFGGAAAIIGTSDAYCASVLDDHPSVPRGHVHRVYNGYDTEGPAEVPPTPASSGDFVVTYTGVLDVHRNPKPFLDAARAIVAEASPLSVALNIRFVGTRKPGVREADLLAGLDGHISLVGHVPPSECATLQAQSDVLVLIHPYPRGGDLVISGKAFDYIASGVPILMLSEPCECADIVARSGMGIVAPPTDVAQIKAALKRLWECKRDGRPTGLSMDRDYVMQFQRAAQVRQIAGILDSVAAR
jgi:glycosyltransferase involved in cell wall biosynthesis